MEAASPVIVTTSQLLTTGVDAPTCKNIVLARVVGSMSEFKQIIGRGTRLRIEYGKFYFHILDYTGTATEKFADPSFDGDPASTGRATIDETGEVVTEIPDEETPAPPEDLAGITGGDDAVPRGGEDELPRKLFVDGGTVAIIHHLVYDLDNDGKKLTCRQLMPSWDKQLEAIRIIKGTKAVAASEGDFAAKLDAILPSVLHEVFGEAKA